MIPPWLALSALRKLPWKLIGIGAAAIALIWFGFYFRSLQVKAGKLEEAETALAECQKVSADQKAQLAVHAKAAADAKASEEAAKANNVEVMEDANEKLLAIAADRDSLGGMLRAAEDRIRRLAAAEGTDHQLASVAAGITARQREIDEALAGYDTACRRDAVRLQALQDEIKPQT